MNDLDDFQARIARNREKYKAGVEWGKNIALVIILIFLAALLYRGILW